ncbi:hypothetical protein KSS87_019692 [Heliosperma pusillum]|nr:hypothetical protein KSS87_019692 [Heliosperma pusillum]
MNPDSKPIGAKVVQEKPTLHCARLLAPHTDGINDIAWSYVKEGILAPLAALLLVAQEEKLSTDGDLDHEGAMYHSMLIEAYKLFDIFERADAALSLYCSSMHEYVLPHKVLADVASVLERAGYTLGPIDLDLRDCYRDCAEVKNASVVKLSDPESPNKKYCLPSSLTHAQEFCGTRYSFPYPGNCQLFHKLKSGSMLNLKKPSASAPQLLRTAASQVENGGSGILLKHLAYIAFRLKRGIKL